MRPIISSGRCRWTRHYRSQKDRKAAHGLPGTSAEACGRANERTENEVLNLEEVNTALKVLLEQREKDKNELEDKILFNVRKLILPIVTP